MAGSPLSVHRRSTDSVSQPSSESEAALSDSEDVALLETQGMASHSQDGARNASSANSNHSETLASPIASSTSLNHPSNTDTVTTQPTFKIDSSSVAAVESSDNGTLKNGKETDREGTTNKSSFRRVTHKMHELSEEKTVQSHTPRLLQTVLEPLAQLELDDKLRAAAEAGKVDLVNELLLKGAIPYSKDREGRNALHIAASESHSGVVECLLQRYPELSGTTDSRDWTPLHFAVADLDEDSTDTLKIILDHSTEEDVNHVSTDQDGGTALHLALLYGQTKTATAILEHKHGAKILETRGDSQQTALHLACLCGLTEVVRLLLKMGADITAQNKDDHTPLYLAARHANDELMQLLLTSAPEEDLKKAAPLCNLRGRNVLFACIDGEKVKWIEKLIDLGADVAVEDDLGWTPLIYACVWGTEEMAKSLLSNGADVNQRPKDGWTALHTIVNHGSVDMTKFLLLQKGIDVDLVTGNTEAETALHIATRSGYTDIVQELLNKGAKMDCVAGDDKETALHIASRSGHVNIVRELLKKGADPTKKTNKSRTALQLATEYGGYDYQMIRVELLKVLKDGARDVGIAQLASSTHWDALGPLLDGIDWQGHSSLKEQLTMTCLASDPDRSSHERLCSMLESKTDSGPGDDEEWTALHWAAYLGYSDLVLWQLRSRPPKGMKATLRSVTSMVQNIMDEKRAKPIMRDSAERESNSDYQTTLDWLRNPPLIPVKTEHKRSFTIPTSERKKCADMFDATITDFYKKDWKSGKDGKVEFLSRVRTVQKVIYEVATNSKPEPANPKKTDKSAGRLQVPAKKAESEAVGPLQIMEDALKQLKHLNEKMDSLSGAADAVEYTKDDLCFRWIHLPANNLEWMMDATERVYRDKGISDEKVSVPEMLQASWRELRGSKKEVRFLRPTCVKESVKHASGQESASQSTPKPTDANAERDKPEGHDEHNNMTAEQNNESPEGRDKEPTQSASEAKILTPYHRLALYMPYLTFSTYGQHTNKTEKSEPVIRDRALIDAYRKACDTRGPKNRGKTAKQTDNTAKDEAANISKTATVGEAKISVTDKKDTKEDVSGGDTQHVEAIVHRTRTLDEFYYDTLQDTDDRDKSQVVWRHLKPDGWKEGDPMHILRVDQLWLWVIDEETIVTSSTNRIDEEEDPIVEGIHDYFREAKGKKRAPTPTTVDEMVKFITTLCIEFMDRSTVNCSNVELSARQIFAKTINQAADNEKKLFEEFRAKIRKKLEKFEEERASVKETQTQRSKPKVTNVLRRFLSFMHTESDESNEKSSGQEGKGKTDAKENLVAGPERTDQELEYLSISAATDLLVEVKDIRDELNILRYLLTQQQSVWERLHDVHDSSKYDHDQQDNEADDVNFRKQGEKWKSPMEFIKDIMEMDKAAQMIQEAVNSILELEQNDASISEAEQARELSIVTIEQGKTLMAFAIVTIVFLPLSFLTSLFAVNISAFPHRGDELFYTPGYIFPLIFGIAAVTVLVVVMWVFKDNILRRIRRWKIRKPPKPGMAENSEKKGDAVPIGTTKEGPPNGKSAPRLPVPRLGRRRARNSDEEKDLGGSSRTDSGAGRGKTITVKVRNTDSDE